MARNSNISFEEFEKIREGANMDKFYEKLKTLPGFPVYEKKVLDNKDDTIHTLLTLMMLHGLADERFDIEMTVLSQEVFGGLLDARLRAEILKENQQ